MQTLDSVPRAERTDIIGPMIRASVKKNEQLLVNKYTKKHHRAPKNLIGSIQSTGSGKKIHHTMISRAVRSRIRHGISINGRLEKRTESSVNRRKQRKMTRRSDWDTINEVTRDSVMNAEERETKKEAAEDDKDEMDVGEEGSGWKELTGQDYVKPTKAKKHKGKRKTTNGFALLHEVEA